MLIYLQPGQILRLNVVSRDFSEQIEELIEGDSEYLENVIAIQNRLFMVYGLDGHGLPPIEMARRALRRYREPADSDEEEEDQRGKSCEKLV